MITKSAMWPGKPAFESMSMAFTAVSLSTEHFPVSMLKHSTITSRIHQRGPDAIQEVWFRIDDLAPVLPVWYQGTLELMTWGSAGPNNHRIWQCREESLQAGCWQSLEPVEIFVPADFACDSGVWFALNEGIQAVMIELKGHPHVYLLTQSASHYYSVMCSHSERMPVCRNQYI